MRKNMWKDESVKKRERRKEQLTDGCGWFFFSSWLLKDSLEKKCSKDRKNLQMFNAVLLEVIRTKAPKENQELV